MALFDVWLKFDWWFKKILHLLVKVRVLSTDLKSHLSLDQANQSFMFYKTNHWPIYLFWRGWLNNIIFHPLRKEFRWLCRGSRVLLSAIPSLWTPRMVKAEIDVFNLVEQIADTGKEVDCLLVFLG